MRWPEKDLALSGSKNENSFQTRVACETRSITSGDNLDTVNCFHSYSNKNHHDDAIIISGKYTWHLNIERVGKGEKRKWDKNEMCGTILTVGISRME